MAKAKAAVAEPEAATNQKTKRKKGSAASQEVAVPKNDPMAQCVQLCQEQRWREAVLLCRRMCAKANQEGNADLYVSLGSAMAKLEYSLRRQMAAALIHASQGLLKKEFLLDVGKQ